MQIAEMLVEIYPVHFANTKCYPTGEKCPNTFVLQSSSESVANASLSAPTLTRRKSVISLISIHGAYGPYPVTNAYFSPDMVSRREIG